MRSSSDGEARPVRTELNSPCVASTDLLMRSRASARSSSISSLIGHQGPDALAGHYPLDVALVVHVEDVDREVVLHAQRQRREVHDAQALLERLHVRDVVEELRVGVRARVVVVDALDAVLGHEQRLGVDLDRAQRRRGVRGEERIDGAGGEDDDAALLEVAHRAAADVGLGHLLHVDGRLHPRVDVALLQRVLELERVEHDGEHPHVVRGGAVHARGGAGDPAVDVARAQDDRDLHAAIVHALDLLGDGAQALRVGPVVEGAHQRLPRQLDQDPLERRRALVAHYSPTAKRAKRLMTTFSPVLAERSPRSCSMVLPSYLSPLTWTWLSSTTSPSHFLICPSTMRGRTFSGLSAACCSNTRASASRVSAGTSSSETQRVWGEAARCSATSLAKATKSSFLATKSVLQSASTSTPTLPLAWM